MRESKAFLIIADDFGWHPRINRAIVALLEDVCISGASLAVNAPYFLDALDLISRSPKIAPLIGLHLNIYRGRPCGDSGQLGPIVRNELFCRSVWRIAWGSYLSSHLRQAIRREFTAQANQMIRRGLRPAVVNSEKHIHWLPTIWNDVLDLANQCNIPYVRACFCPVDCLRGCALRSFGYINKFIAASKSFAGRMPHALYGVGSSGPRFIRQFPRWLAEAPPGVSEIVCHPGHSYGTYDDYPDEREFISRLDISRAIELSFLKTIRTRYNMRVDKAYDSGITRMPAFVAETV